MFHQKTFLLTGSFERERGVVQKVGEQLDVLLRPAADLHRVEDLGQAALLRVRHVDELLSDPLLQIF